jgi:hypothetical protein
MRSSSLPTGVESCLQVQAASAVSTAAREVSGRSQWRISGGRLAEADSGWVALLDEIDVNPAVLGFALAASVSTGILFGLAPAMTAARTDLQPLLKEGARGSSSRGSRLRW